MGQFEWIIILLIGVGLLLWEWVKTRRLIRKDRAKKLDRPPD